MTAEPEEVAAARAALELPPGDRIDFDGFSVLTTKTAGKWRVIPFPLGFEGGPEVYLVAPLGDMSPGANRHAVRLPERGWVRLHGETTMGELVRAYPDLPPATVATLAALALGPNGPERALLSEKDIAEGIADSGEEVPEGDRPFVHERTTGGSWRLAFLSIRMEWDDSEKRWARRLRRVTAEI